MRTSGRTLLWQLDLLLQRQILRGPAYHESVSAGQLLPCVGSFIVDRQLAGIDAYADFPALTGTQRDPAPAGKPLWWFLCGRRQAYINLCGFYPGACTGGLHLKLHGRLLAW